MFILASNNCIQNILYADVHRKGIFSKQQQFSFIKEPGVRSCLKWCQSFSAQYQRLHLDLVFELPLLIMNLRFMQCISEKDSFNNNYNLAAHKQASNAI